MNTVNVYVVGNGSAWVDNEHPLVGEDFTLHCRPDTGEQLLDVIATDEVGHSIAMEVALDATYTWSSYWIGTNIYITVTFSGDVPPVPPTDDKRLVALMAAIKRRKKKLFI